MGDGRYLLREYRTSVESKIVQLNRNGAKRHERVEVALKVECVYFWSLDNIEIRGKKVKNWR